MSAAALPTSADVTAAYARIKDRVRRTPVRRNRFIDSICGRSVLFKCENLQRTGSYKIRGAFNNLIALKEGGQLLAGVVAASSGNHGQAVAKAAYDLGVPAVVVVPENIRPAKLAALHSYGARVIPVSPHCDELYEVAASVAASEGFVEIHPFDNPLTIAGQGTCAYETVVSQTDPAVVLVPIGGGGLAAGTILGLEAAGSTAATIAVEPSGADDSFQSFRAGHRIARQATETIADALLSPAPGAITFAINGPRLADVITVSDEQIVGAMRLIWERLKLVVEPSGAVSLAGLIHHEIPGNEPALVIISGGNRDFAPPVGFAR